MGMFIAFSVIYIISMCSCLSRDRGKVIEDLLSMSETKKCYQRGSNSL